MSALYIAGYAVYWFVTFLQEYFLIPLTLGFRKPGVTYPLIWAAYSVVDWIVQLLALFSLLDENTLALAVIPSEILLLVLIFVLAAGNWLSKLFAYALRWSLAMFAGAFEYLLMRAFDLQDPYIRTVSDIPASLVVLLAPVGLTLLGYYVFSKRLRNIVFSVSDIAQGLLIISIPLVFTAILVPLNRDVFKQRPLNVLNFALLGLLSVLALFFYLDWKKQKRLAAEKSALEKMIKVNAQYLDAMREQQDGFAKFRHDAYNHLETIQTLIAEGNAEKAKSYCAQFSGVHTENPELHFCDNQVLNALLVNKTLAAKHDHITLCYTGACPEMDWISEVDLICVFSNLLDNAIENSPRCETVQLVCRYLKDSLLICCSNPVSPQKNEFIAKNKLDRGHGINIVKEVASKYHGSVDVALKDGLFTVNVSLFKTKNIKSKKEEQPL